MPVQQMDVTLSSDGAVLISYEMLMTSPETLQSSIAVAFGSDHNCLGIIIITDLPGEFKSLRERLLKLAGKFAALPESVRERYADPTSRYSFGWSHGKEIMNGNPDLLKGSYYANPLIDDASVTTEQKQKFPEYYGHNIWPGPMEKGVEGFEVAFKALGSFIFKVGHELTAACQPFASSHLVDQSLPLAALISRNTTKARLLHYFPPVTPMSSEDEPVDSWCGFHLDHSLITGLCSAMYLSYENSGEPVVRSAPTPTSGLYIKTRGGKLTKVSIPSDCLAFQTGEALELATNGNLRATPHCVRAGGYTGSDKISRETFALFMQPDTEAKIGPCDTFGSFSKRVFSEHYDSSNDGSVEA